MIHSDRLSVVRTIAETRAVVAGWRARGLSVAMVPTMGSLHPGHLSLVELARGACDRVLATIFVNPLQFGPTEDFTSYPRDETRDFALLDESGCGAVFAPGVSEMFADGGGSFAQPATRVSVEPLSQVLCGANRPGHFDGVATIVTKLLLIGLPDMAFFGEKDYQQLTIVKRLASDLDIPVRIAGGPTVREPDGLALSSRNRYLDAAQRAIAPKLFATLRTAAAQIAGGASAESILARARGDLSRAGFERVDYLTLAAGDTLETLSDARPGARLFGAAWLGRTRLIDNLRVPPH
jgi:pantoate--beta-alanine ligase